MLSARLSIVCRVTIIAQCEAIDVKSCSLSPMAWIVAFALGCHLGLYMHDGT